MIERSENDPADHLMEQVLDKNTGPLMVTQDLEALGLKNTFLAGYFYPGAPLLKRFTTTANQRTDVSTDPDAYNQTTPTEMGMLLDDLYQCSQTGGGALAAVFPGEITQNKCRSMITYLTRNKIAVLLEAGLPDGVQIAHKHGWITSNDGLIHTIGDAGIIYTSGGNYVLAIFLYHPTQLLFDPANQLVAQLSTAVYNYFNLTNK
jgi:beta-lactamase class A